MTSSQPTDTPHTATADRLAIQARRWLLASGEVLLIVLLYFAYAGWAPPDVNESHYLPKARHFWEPQWCDRDIFLESGDAHLVFFWAFGFVTHHHSLVAAAWFGRFLAWLLLAIGWRRLSNSLAPGTLIPVLSAAWFIIVLEHCHMSGEWIIGGVEGKAFAYGLLWLGLADLIDGHWRRMWIWFGLASLLHVIVGGWATLAALITCVSRSEIRQQWSRMVPFLVAGFLIAIPSILAGLRLDQGTESALVTAASRILVYQRLTHHLTITGFQHWFIVRFAAAAILWFAISGYAARNSPPEQRLNRFVAIPFAYALFAIVIELVIWNQDLTARILKYYWYRLADASLAVGIALTLTSALVRKRKLNPDAAGWLLVFLLLVPTCVLATELTIRHNDVRPRADRRWDPLITNPGKRLQRFHNWRRVCNWIKDNTPADALFLTPRAQQTFKWYAERAEVVCWKDIPQDARHILEWRRRMTVWFPPPVLQSGPTALSDQQLVALAREYNVQYFVVERGKLQRQLGPAFDQVYPTGIQENSEFAVYQIRH